VFVEEEEAGGFTGLDGERGEGAVFVVELEHAAEIDVADDVDVVEEEGLCRRVANGPDRVGVNEWQVTSIFKKEPGGFFQAAAGIKQEIVFAGNFNAHSEIVAGFQVIDDHVREVMDVDDDVVDAKRAQARESDFEERAASDFDEGLGARVGEGTQARAKAGGKDHGFHDKTSGEWRVASGEKRKELTQRAQKRERKRNAAAQRTRREEQE
jgi:hypothetical protein